MGTFSDITMGKYVWFIAFSLIIISSVINAKEKKEKKDEGSEGGLSDLFGKMVQNTGEVLANKAKGKPISENGEISFENKKDTQKGKRGDKKDNEFDIFRQLEREKENKEKQREKPTNNGKEDIEKSIN